MMNLFRKIKWQKIYNLLSFSLVLFLIESIIYHFFVQLKIQKYWIAIPVLLYLILIFASKFIKRICVVAISLEITSLLSIMLLFCSIKINYVNTWFEIQFEIVAFIIIIAFFISLTMSRFLTKENNVEQKNDFSNQLFNLFYLNTSKAHEIAMLIDNKIMKTIEREQVSEEFLKYNTSFTLGKKDTLSTEMGYSIEDSSKKRVYENFDVKTTKSIMLRKIYETTQKKKDNQEKLRVGDLTIFENIELQQRNIDDTVMILNVLQDSKIRNQSNNDLEINFNKMMDKMLDDYTIDYTFAYGKECEESRQYIIQIPYKSTDNFENGYQHNDLQLGKLSLIGIYRGEIDFSKRDSISSKFLELMSESYNQEMQRNEDVFGMKLSRSSSSPNDIKFEFHHKKLKEKLHLIDVIAIIQELNFDRSE
jgi:hypothetical protein